MFARAEKCVRRKDKAVSENGYGIVRGDPPSFFLNARGFCERRQLRDLSMRDAQALVCYARCARDASRTCKCVLARGERRRDKGETREMKLDPRAEIARLFTFWSAVFAELKTESVKGLPSSLATPLHGSQQRQIYTKCTLIQR